MAKRILAGPHAVIEALRTRPEGVAAVYWGGAGSLRKRHREVAELARRAGVHCEQRETAELGLLAEGLRHQGVLAIAGDYRYLDLDTLIRTQAHPPLLVALDQITDPRNFGAILRSAVALGADGVITHKDRACPVTSAVVRASAGATEYARVARVTNLARALSALREQGLQVVGLDAAAPVELAALPYPQGGRVLVMGSEGKGLRRLVRENCDLLARVLAPGPIASLNASVAAGVALYESARARTQARDVPE